MKVLILCGGKGTRLGGGDTPKPLVEIGGKPILWHIMSRYAKFGLKEFVLLLGHQSWKIKDYFLTYKYRHNNFTLPPLPLGNFESSRPMIPVDWEVSLVETGENSGTADRILNTTQYFNSSEDFMLTYGDGVADIDLTKLYKHHQRNKRIATITAVRPPVRFGNLAVKGNAATSFGEKQTSTGWINGGFFVFRREFVRAYLKPGMLEQGPLQKCAGDDNLTAYRHPGFWQCMDTPRDLEYLQSLWEKGNAPWAI